MKIEARIHLELRATEYSETYCFTRRVELNTPPFNGSMIIVDFGSYRHPTQFALVVHRVEDFVFSSREIGICAGVEVFVEDGVNPGLLRVLKEEAAKRNRGWTCERLGGKK